MRGDKKRAYIRHRLAGVPPVEAVAQSGYKTSDPPRIARKLEADAEVIAALENAEPEWELDEADEADGDLAVPDGVSPREFFQSVVSNPTVPLAQRLVAAQRLEQMDRRDNPASDAETVLADLRSRVDEVQRAHRERLLTNEGLAAELNGLASMTRPELAVRVREFVQWVLHEAPRG